MICTRCTGDGASTRDGLCGACRLQTMHRPPKQYVFSDSLRDELRGAYAGPRPALTAAIDRLVAKTGWKRFVFLQEAVRCGFATTGTHRRWTPAEDAYLRENTGHLRVASMVRKLKRSRKAVECRIFALGLSRAPQDGYSVSDLASLLAVNPKVVSHKVQRGLFGRIGAGEVRISDVQVAGFLRKYPDEYDLRRVDQVWFKAMIFGEAANYGGSEKRVSDEAVSGGPRGGAEAGVRSRCIA